MPKLNIIEEFDILTELQSPDFIFSTDSLEEKLAFCKYITNLSSHRILLLHSELLNVPFVIAGLTEEHIESLFKDSGYNIKKALFSNMSNQNYLKQVQEFMTELDNRNKTTENSTRLKNILQYLRDNKSII